MMEQTRDPLVAEDQPIAADLIRQNLLADLNLVPYHYSERRPGPEYGHLHPRILRRHRLRQSAEALA